MKNIYMTILAIAISAFANAQEEEKGKSDTTRIKLGPATEIIIVEKGKYEKDSTDFDDEFDEDETVYHGEETRPEPHWAGLDFGFTMLMDQGFAKIAGDEYPYWQNDAARSQVWNLNLLEHKFNIAREYFGVTTGLGFSFTSVAFSDNYVLRTTPDTLFAEIDTLYNYSKNKLKASYLTVPLLLEFNTNINENKSFYLAAGVVGGVRIASKTKRVGEYDGKEFTDKVKDTYHLNPFRLDAVARLGYSHWGVFASYNLLPLFDDAKTAAVYPLTFGLSLNF